MPHHQSKLFIPAALAAISLIGCGEGTPGSTAANGNTPPPPKAGETYTTSILVDDKPLSETTYTIYSVVDDQGKLSDIPLADIGQEAQLPHVLIKKSTSKLAKINQDGSIVDISDGLNKLSPAIPLAKIESCYGDIWKQLKVAKPNATRQELAMGIAQFGVSIDDLCTYASASGMTLDEYVQLFQTVTKYFPGQQNIEARMVQFFMDLNITPKRFITKLSNKGYTWEDFVKRLAANKGNVYGFINGYKPSATMTLEQYIGDYMTRPGPTAAVVNHKLKLFAAYLAKDITPGFLAKMEPARVVAQATTTLDQYVNTAKETIEVVDKGLEVGKKVWDFIRSGVAVDNTKGAEHSTYVLSASDPATINYEYAKASTSKVVSFVGKRLWWENYRVDFTLEADYDAKNPKLPGQWMPNINVRVNKSTADYGYVLNGSVKVSNTVNRGSLAAPIPEAQLDVTISAKNWSVNTQQVSFIANGATGARLK
jgi:hypothetical protein